jgi:hypothetical protein
MSESTPIMYSEPKLMYLDGSMSSKPILFGAVSIVEKKIAKIAQGDLY